MGQPAIPSSTPAGDLAAAAEFDRPLLLSPGQDLRGYLYGTIGGAALFATAAASILAVLLIFAFVILGGSHFATTRGGDEEYDRMAARRGAEADKAYQAALARGADAAAAEKAKAAAIASYEPSLSVRLGRMGARSKELVSGMGWYPAGHKAEFGGWPLLFGSLLVTGAALAIAVPLGLLTAVVLSDIVPFGLRQVIKPVMELLAAIPSVAFGFFAIVVVAPLLQRRFGLDTGANALNASLILAVMALPTIVSVAEDALTALGRDLREASYAMGATRAETIWKVVVPASHSGILAAVVLGMMRAIGETMVVWMASGNAAKVPAPWWDLTESIRTMTATIAGEMGETAIGSIHRSALFAVGVVLLTFTFVLNLVAEGLTARFRREMGLAAWRPPSRSRSRLRAGLRRTWSACCAPFRRLAQLLGLLLRAAWRVLTAPLLLPRALGAVWPAFRAAWNGLAGRMRVPARRAVDRAFTAGALASVLLIAAALVVVLGPILARGTGAVVFRGTVEFRKAQRELFGRGAVDALTAEVAATDAARKGVYDVLRKMSWLDPADRIDRVGEVFRELKKQLDHRLGDARTRLDAQSKKVLALGDSATREELNRLDALRQEVAQTAARNDEIVRAAKRIRRRLEAGYETADRAEAVARMSEVAEWPQKELLAGTVAEVFASLARDYLGIVRGAALELRDAPVPVEPDLTYAKAYAQVREIVCRRLLGPESRAGISHLPAEVRYGASRWDLAEKYRRELLTAQVWALQGRGQARVRTAVPRAELFADEGVAGMRELFAYVDGHLEAMLAPRWTFYGRYFTDPSTPGHFLGGVGPEVLGTLALTVLAIVAALPLGVVAAAYLVEVGGDGAAVRALRMSINTLAGVPSIVFGLFGLAFFVMLTGKPCILAGALTLAVLVLPVVIRASEEAIRAVPRNYKEAALGLGAGRLRCFATVTLPAALPGVLTGTILSMSRAAGETAPILFTAAAATAGFARSVFDKTPALSYSSYDLAVGDRLADLVPHNQYGMVSTLIILVLLLNAAAIFVRSKVSRKLRGQ